MSKKWIEKLDLPYAFVWDEQLTHFACEISDSEELTIISGGCEGDNEGYYIEYRIWEEVPMDEVYWRQKAIHLCKLFQVPFYTDALEASRFELEYIGDNRLIFEFSDDQQENFRSPGFLGIEATFFDIQKAKYNSFLTIDYTLYRED